MVVHDRAFTDRPITESSLISFGVKTQELTLKERRVLPSLWTAKPTTQTYSQVSPYFCFGESWSILVFLNNY